MDICFLSFSLFSVSCVHVLELESWISSTYLCILNHKKFVNRDSQFANSLLFLKKFSLSNVLFHDPCLTISMSKVSYLNFITFVENKKIKYSRILF